MPQSASVSPACSSLLLLFFLGAVLAQDRSKGSDPEAEQAQHHTLHQQLGICSSGERQDEAQVLARGFFSTVTAPVLPRQGQIPTGMRRSRG